MSIENLLLRTAFVCMACDGEVDKDELNLIYKIHNETSYFGAINVKEELNQLFDQLKINNQIILNYFKDLKNSNLSESDELKIIEVAIDTIKADQKIEYSEIKFFKVIRSYLKISNDKILNIHPDFEEYLEDDIISESFLLKLVETSFSNLNEINIDVLE